jgi:hypothetical protein
MFGSKLRRARALPRCSSPRDDAVAAFDEGAACHYPAATAERTRRWSHGSRRPRDGSARHDIVLARLANAGGGRSRSERRLARDGATDDVLYFQAEDKYTKSSPIRRALIKKPIKNCWTT